MTPRQQRCVGPVNSPVAQRFLVGFLEPQPSGVSLEERQRPDQSELMRQHLKLASNSISDLLHHRT